MGIANQLIRAKLVEDLQARQQEQQAASLKPALGQFGAETAQQLGGLLTSGIPQAASLGAEQLEGLLQQRQGGPVPGIGEPSFKDFTAESLGEYQQTGDPNVLVRYTDPLGLRRANQADDRLALAQLASTRPSPAQQEKIIANQISLDTLDSLIMQSDASYFGNGFSLISDARKEVAKRFGGENETKFLDFWREYDTWMQDIRAEKYGTQFTPNEERIFEGLKANPSMKYSVGMNAIQQQRKMVNRARLRRNSVLEEFGFDVPARKIGGGADVIDKTSQ